MIALSPERAKKYDDYAISEWGIPSAVLMENAGRSTYRLMREAYLRDRCKVVVLAGRGNNGGDGFVIARYALRDGFPVEVCLLGRPEALKGDARLNMELYLSLGGAMAAVEDAAAAEKAIQGSDVIVDAIFGTGLAKEVRGLEAAAIDEINRSGKTVIAVDIPSGLDGAEGRPPGGRGAGDPHLHLRPREARASFSPGRLLQGEAHGRRYFASRGGGRSCSASTPAWWTGRWCAASSARGSLTRTRACSEAWPSLRDLPARRARRSWRRPRPSR